MASRHFQLGHCRRPTHADIAATPLERLPSHARDEAAYLLREGRDALTGRLNTPAAKVALRCQGVDINQLLGASDLLALEKARCVTPGPGQRKKPLKSSEHAVQLLAQVLWEEDLCQRSCRFPADTAPDGLAGPAPVPFGHHFGAARDYYRGDALRTARPASALEVRLVAHGEQIDATRRHWEDRVRALHSARNERDRRLDGLQDSLHQRNRTKEEHVAAFKEEQVRHLTQYAHDLTSMRHMHTETQAAKLSADAAAHAQIKGRELASRAGSAWEHRMEHLHRAEEHLSGLVSVATRRRGGAGERRRGALEAKALGPPQLHTCRELAHWQQDRLVRLQAHDRTVLRECLGEPPCTPIPLGPANFGG